MFWRRKGKQAQSSRIRDAAFQQIFRAWSVDEADVKSHEHGFDWLPGNHLVRVRFYNNIAAPDLGRFRLTIHTEYLRKLPGQTSAFVRNVVELARYHCPTYSVVYPPTAADRQHFEGRDVEMSLFSSAYISEETAQWLPRFLAQMAIMQPIDAERNSFDATGMLGGGIPAIAGNERRATVSDVLNVDRDLHASSGQETSRWFGSLEFEEFAEQHARTDLCVGTGNFEGMSLETPFGSDTALIAFTTDDVYPPLGNGLFVGIQIRTSQDFDQTCEAAARMNYLESVDWSDFPQMGCWHPLQVSEREVRLAHTCFVPNLFFAEGLVTNLGLWSLARVQYAKHALRPDMPNLTMLEVLEARMRR